MYASNVYRKSVKAHPSQNRRSSWKKGEDVANQYDAATFAAGKKKTYFVQSLKYTECTQCFMPFTHFTAL